MKVSPACAHCYAARWATFTGHAVWGADAPRRMFGDDHWREPVRWNRAAAAERRRRRVFCASMADVFEARPDLDRARARLWALIEATPWLDWQLLTKRPEEIARRVPRAWLRTPPANVWYGATVENQTWAEQRIPALVQVPATVRFLSCEPLLGALDLARWLDRLAWIIIGGENGPRPFDLDDARALVDQARRAGVACFVKQLGTGLGLRDRKGGDPAEWPRALRVRQFPPVGKRGVDKERADRKRAASRARS